MPSEFHLKYLWYSESQCYKSLKPQFFFLRNSHSSRNIYTPHGIFVEEDDEGNVILGSWRKENDSETSFLSIRNIPRKHLPPRKKFVMILSSIS